MRGMVRGAGVSPCVDIRSDARGTQRVWAAAVERPPGTRRVYARQRDAGETCAACEQDRRLQIPRAPSVPCDAVLGRPRRRLHLTAKRLVHTGGHVPLVECDVVVREPAGQGLAQAASAVDEAMVVALRGASAYKRERRESRGRLVCQVTRRDGGGLKDEQQMRGVRHSARGRGAFRRESGKQYLALIGARWRGGAVVGNLQATGDGASSGRAGLHPYVSRHA